jgi:hypothetical protein
MSKLCQYKDAPVWWRAAADFSAPIFAVAMLQPGIVFTPSTAAACVRRQRSLDGRGSIDDGWQAMREAEGPHPATGVALPHLVVQSGMFWDPRRQKISDPRALRLWAATPRGPLTVGRGSRRAARQCPPR